MLLLLIFGLVVIAQILVSPLEVSISSSLHPQCLSLETFPVTIHPIESVRQEDEANSKEES
jgi:hypothetical protein